MSQSARQRQEPQAAGPFAGARVKPVRAPLGYRLAQLVAAAWMLLVTAAYLAMIAALVYGLWQHATENLWMLPGNLGEASVPKPGPRARRDSDLAFFAPIFGILGYVVPLVIGAILALFMIRVFFPGSGGSLGIHFLSRAEEPRFFEFVEGICSALRAPVPSKIAIICEPQAAAQLSGSWLNPFSRTLTLHVGLPLAYGLTQQQLAAIVAHEVGHFSQRGGMRLNSIVRRASFRFERAVYERANLDRFMVDCSQNEHGLVSVFGYLGRTFLWITRAILWVFMKVGMLLAAVLERQMEFDADRYAARIAGSEGFEPMMERVVILQGAAYQTFSDLEMSWRERRLADDVTTMILANEERIGEKALGRLEAEIRRTKTGWFDSHPATGMRVERMRQEPDPGIFHCEDPARELFNDFTALSKRVTLKLYRAVLGQEFRLRHLVSAETEVAKHKAQDEDMEALLRATRGLLFARTPFMLSIEKLEPPADARKAAAQMIEARKAIENTGDALNEARKAVYRAEAQESVARKLRMLHRAGLADIEQVRQADAIDAKSARLASGARAAVNPIESAAQTRLRRALELLHTPQVGQRMPDAAEAKTDAERALAASYALESALPSVLELQENLESLRLLIALLEKNAELPPLHNAIRKAFGRGYQLLVRIRDGLAQTPYPFDHGAGAVTIADYAIGNIEAQGGYPVLLAMQERAIDNLISVYYRSIGRLARTAEKVEAALGFQPMSKPPVIKPDPDEDDPFARSYKIDPKGFEPV